VLGCRESRLGGSGWPSTVTTSDSTNLYIFMRLNTRSDGRNRQSPRLSENVRHYQYKTRCHACVLRCALFHQQ
jgi:hypothetical protein